MVLKRPIRKLRMVLFYWRPKRLTLDNHPPMYAWLWWNFEDPFDANRSEKIFGGALALFFGVVFALGFSGKLDRWEVQGYWIPFIIIIVLCMLFIGFILLAFCSERFARWIRGVE